MFSHDLIPQGVGVAALAWVALWTSHQLADHWVQTGFQAVEKDKSGWPGRLACAGHVAGHMVTSVACLLMLRIVGLTIHAGAITVGLAVIAISHYWADRRTTLRALADRMGKGDFYRLGQPRKVALFVPGDGGSLVRASVFLVDEAGDPVPDVGGNPIEVPLDNNAPLGTGAHSLDQGFHFWWLFVAALVITVMYLAGW